MAFIQFGMVALGAISATVCVLAGHPEAGAVIGGGCFACFVLSML